MNKNSVLLITKDAFCTGYLPQYGNKYWQGRTPNLDELAEKGLVFERFYTAAPSSAMAYLSMFTGKYPYEQEIKTYRPASGPYNGITLFDKAYDAGYQCHVIWDENWMDGAYKYSYCYGKNTQLHPLKGLRQGVGAHYLHDGFLKPDDQKSQFALDLLEKEVIQITSGDEKIFAWIHLPHVINGRTSYGSDVDLYDKAIGIMRRYFCDDNIFVSADHGNMNGQRGKLCYGFDVYEPAIRIPLITPRRDYLPDVSKPLCNVDMYEILFGGELTYRPVIFSDSAYYAQPNRDLALIKGDYKYIYHKSTKREELFDLIWDPNEQFNLISDVNWDVDRKINSPS